MQTSAVSGAGVTTAKSQSLASDFNGFLKLLTAQLRNQDPLAPMDADKFTSQLVQFASVEQQLATNGKLEKLNTLVDTSMRAGALGYLGAEVEIEGGFIRPEPGKSGFHYELAREAQDVAIKIHDPSGKLVLQESGGLAKGANSYVWNGRVADGRLAEPGTYRVDVTAEDASGRSVPVTMRTTGTVDRVALDGATPMLVIEDASVPLSAVRSITRADL